MPFKPISRTDLHLLQSTPFLIKKLKYFQQSKYISMWSHTIHNTLLTKTNLHAAWWWKMSLKHVRLVLELCYFFCKISNFSALRVCLKKTSRMFRSECLQWKNMGRVISKLFITTKIRIMLLHGVETMLLVRAPQPLFWPYYSFMQQGRVFLTWYEPNVRYTKWS